MKKFPKSLLLIVLVFLYLKVDAQNNNSVQKQDSLLAPVILNNGIVQIKNLKLFPEITSLENLYLEVSLINYKSNNKFVQNPVRIEVERLNNGKIERIEIARFFLPWLDGKKAGGARFIFDISAYSSLFKQASNVRIESTIVAQPLELNLHFRWKKGQSPAKADKIIRLWHSSIWGFPYADKANPINKQIKSNSITVSKDIKYALLKIYLSGKELDNKIPSEADCSKFYFLNINGQTIAKRPIWRDDCSMNSLFPQNGPWTYSRANWCPGQALRVYDHFIPLGTDTTLNIELQLQDAAKANPLLQSYILSANLILFKEAQFDNDAAIIEILAPNKSIEHNRYNPICSSPVIRVRNTGVDTLRTVLIKYGYNNKIDDNRYRWRGELAFMEEEIVYLPPLNWYFYDQKNKPMAFTVSIDNVNYKADEYIGNNKISTALNLAPVYPGKISIQFIANQAAADNILELVDDMGIPLFEASDFVNDSVYTFDLDLLPGCYEFIVYDQQGDGIFLPSNKKGKGSLKLIDTKTKAELNNFEPNFGAEIRQQFMILK